MQKKLTHSIFKIFLLLVVALSLFENMATAQTIKGAKRKFFYFPYPMEKKWKASIGATLTTMPSDVTEELRFRVPAADFQIMRKVSSKWALHGRVGAQLFQNLLTIGPVWSTRINDRFSFSAGDDIGWWFGFIELEGFKTRGNGWQNYPHASLGYRFHKNVFLTLKAELLMNLSTSTKTGEIKVNTDYRLISGSAFTLALEQPFYGKKCLTLGFRAIYTDFFWQTWALFESFDRNIFYPQIIVAFIL